MKGNMIGSLGISNSLLRFLLYCVSTDSLIFMNILLYTNFSNAPEAIYLSHVLSPTYITSDNIEDTCIEGNSVAKPVNYQ